MDKLLTVQEAADFLSCHRQSVYRNKELPRIEIPGVGIRYSEKELVGYLEQKTAKLASTKGQFRTPPPNQLTASNVSTIVSGRNNNGGVSEMPKGKFKTRLVYDNGAINLRPTKSGQARFYIDFYDAEGKRTKKVVKNATSFEEAKIALDKEVQEAYDTKFGIVRKKARISFGELADMYTDWAKINKKSWKTDIGRIKGMRVHFKDKIINGITSQDVEGYKAKRVSEGVKLSTVNKSLQILSKMLNLAIDWGYLDQNPCKGVKRYAEEPFRRKRVLTEEEEARLFRVKMPSYLKPMLRIFLNTGLRRQELLKLTWDDVDFKNLQIYVRETKTEKSRYIPINETVHAELIKLYEAKKGDNLVFINKKTGKGFVCIRKVFERALERAGIKNLLLLDLRRTFATRLLSAGVDIITVQHLLGHTSVTTTQIYTMTNQDEKRRAVSRLEPKNGPDLSRICPTEESETEKYVLFKDFISMN